MIAFHDLVLHQGLGNGREIHLIFTLWADKVHTVEKVENSE